MVSTSGVRGEAKRMGRDRIRMGGGRLLSIGVRGEAKPMGRDRIRMGGGCLGWLSSVGGRGEAKRMGGGRSRQELVAVLVTWALWGGC